MTSSRDTGAAPSADQLHASDSDPKRGEANAIIEWTFVDRLEPARPIVRIFEDGRVEVSHDLLYGGEPMREARLSEHELARFQEAMVRLTHGIPREPVVFSELYGRRHRIVVRAAGAQGEIDLTTSMRFIELGGIGDHPIPLLLVTPLREGSWRTSDGGTRFEAMARVKPEQLRLRAVWLELESEFLRTAGHALFPGDTGPIQRVPLIGSAAP